LQNKESGFFTKGGNKIAKVPVSGKEALTSDLMGMMEKRRFQKFIEIIQNFEEANPKTYQGTL
jgi:Rab GDP dissociation inhibitor